MLPLFFTKRTRAEQNEYEQVVEAFSMFFPTHLYLLEKKQAIRSTYHFTKMIQLFFLKAPMIRDELQPV